MECVRPCRSTCCQGETPSVFGTAADNPRLPRVLSYHSYLQQEARGYYVARRRPTKSLTMVGCTRLAAMQFLAENADNPIPAASTSNLLKQRAYGKYIAKQMPRGQPHPPLATHGAGAYGCTSARGLLASAVNPPVRCIRWGVLGYAITMDVSCRYSRPTVTLHRGRAS